MNKLSMDNVAAMNVQYSHFSFEYFLKSMNECGIHNIELWSAEPHFWRENYASSGDAAKKIREYRKMMDDMGMKVIMYLPETLAYPFDPASSNIHNRNRTIDMFKRAVDDALEFGTNQVFCNSGCGLYDESRESAWERTVDTFQKVADYAAKMNVSLNMEQLQPYESNLVCTAQDVKKMLDDIDRFNVHSCLDLGAMAVADETIEEFYENVGKKHIQHVHFSDRNHEIPGDRDLPLTHYIQYLEKEDYSGYLSLEVNDSIYLDNPHKAFMKSADVMKMLLAD